MLASIRKIGIATRRIDNPVARRTDLDGLRGLAIVLVLVEHTALADQYLLPFTPAVMGVTVFFVLSGYLITSLLMREERIDLRNFYARRALRLGPGLLALLAFVAVVGIVTESAWIPGVVSAVFYVNNLAHTAGVDTGLAQHTWTLAIEEQFYLLWPIAMILVPRRWLLPAAIALAIVGSVVFTTRSGPWFYSTLAHAGGLMAGGAAALARVRLPQSAGAVGIALIGSAALLWSQPMAIIGAVLVISARTNLLNPLAVIGRRAYSLYLWSWPLVALFGGPAALPWTIVVAEACFRLIERPLLDRFHARLAPRFPSRPDQRLSELSTVPSSSS
jgi:peptidoglycan/LPS O-acetylase OafA/YrhL